MKLRILDYNLLFQPEVIITASSEASEFPASNLKRVHRSKVWRSENDVTDAHLVIDLGTSEAINSVAFFFDPMRGVPLSETAAITIQASETNVWDDPVLSQPVPIDYSTSTAVHFFPTDEGYRYWRVIVSDPENADSRVELSKLFLGRALPLSRAPSNGFGYELQDQSRVERTGYGHEFVDIYPQVRSISLDFQAMPYADLMALEGMYRRVGKSIPVVVALDYEGTEYDAGHFMLYSKIDQAFNARHVSGQYFNQGFTFREVF